MIYSKEELLSKLEKKCSEMKWSKRRFATEADINYQQIQDWYRKDRDNRIAYTDAMKIINMVEPLKNSAIFVVGVITGNNRVEMYKSLTSFSKNLINEAKMLECLVALALPGGISINGLVALTIDNDLMAPAIKKGSVLYYQPLQQEVQPNHINEFCVVETEEGEVFTREVKNGSKQGYYNLSFPATEEIKDVKIRFCAFVESIKPFYKQ